MTTVFNNFLIKESFSGVDKIQFLKSSLCCNRIKMVNLTIIGCLIIKLLKLLHVMAHDLEQQFAFTDIATTSLLVQCKMQECSLSLAKSSSLFDYVSIF
jgi:hypothetical protein